jgi:hypothetical protein
MADSECIIYLGTSRSTALLTYKRLAEEALARADLLNKPSLATLQALTIYLVCTNFFAYPHITVLSLVLNKCENRYRATFVSVIMY